MFCHSRDLSSFWVIGWLPDHDEAWCIWMIEIFWCSCFYRSFGSAFRFSSVPVFLRIDIKKCIYSKLNERAWACRQSYTWNATTALFPCLSYAWYCREMHFLLGYFSESLCGGGVTRVELGVKSAMRTAKALTVLLTGRHKGMVRLDDGQTRGSRGGEARWGHLYLASPSPDATCCAVRKGVRGSCLNHGVCSWIFFYLHDTWNYLHAFSLGNNLVPCPKIGWKWLVYKHKSKHLKFDLIISSQTKVQGVTLHCHVWYTMSFGGC